MALSTDQLVAIRRHIGSTPDDATLNAIYDRTDDVDELVLEILETRAADLRAQPDSFAVPGEYSQSNSNQLKSLEEKIASLGGGDGTVNIVPPPARRVR